MLKKISLGVTVLLAFMIACPKTSNAQCLEEGNIIIDGYYGFPNLYTSVFKTAYANANEGATQVGLKIKGLGPVGLRGEYLVSEKVGVGIDIGMNNTSISYNETSDHLNSTTGLYETKTYNYKFSTQKIGVMGTFNYHFVNKDKVDAYFVFGAGYGNRSYKFTSTDPDYVTASVKGIIPVAMRVGVGMRYFFTKNIGANLGLGFGQGGIINAGLSFKI